MSIADIEQRVVAEEPIGVVDAPNGISIQSTDIYDNETRFADFFTENPRLAHTIWQETALEILEAEDLDPRAIYMAAFNQVAASRAEGHRVDMPVQPNDEVLEHLGATSMFMHSSREYYRNTQGH